MADEDEILEGEVAEPIDEGVADDAVEDLADEETV